ncbi:MAG: cysteine peptidase family C39 domain-containing protein [Candidatus Omnitrophica bacterium]|nr:cysteine peptidase family C39 domain-containing protein [Candidatus Omnitrophota bacterium]
MKLNLWRKITSIIILQAFILSQSAAIVAARPLTEERKPEIEKTVSGQTQLRVAMVGVSAGSGIFSGRETVKGPTAAVSETIAGLQMANYDLTAICTVLKNSGSTAAEALMGVLKQGSDPQAAFTALVNAGYDESAVRNLLGNSLSHAEGAARGPADVNPGVRSQAGPADVVSSDTAVPGTAKPSENQPAGIQTLPAELPSHPLIETSSLRQPNQEQQRPANQETFNPRQKSESGVIAVSVMKNMGYSATEIVSLAGDAGKDMAALAGELHAAGFSVAEIVTAYVAEAVGSVVDATVNLINCAVQALASVFSGQNSPVTALADLAYEVIFADIQQTGKVDVQGNSILSSMLAIKSVAGEHGIKLEGSQMSMAQLSGQAMPAIVHLDGNHWAVVESVQGDMVSVVDNGNAVQMSVAAFQARWDGNALVSVGSGAGQVLTTAQMLQLTGAEDCGISGPDGVGTGGDGDGPSFGGSDSGGSSFDGFSGYSDFGYDVSSSFSDMAAADLADDGEFNGSASMSFSDMAAADLADDGEFNGSSSSFIDSVTADMMSDFGSFFSAELSALSELSSFSEPAAPAGFLDSVAAFSRSLFGNYSVSDLGQVAATAANIAGSVMGIPGVGYAVGALADTISGLMDGKSLSQSIADSAFGQTVGGFMSALSDFAGSLSQGVIDGEAFGDFAGTLASAALGFTGIPGLGIAGQFSAELCGSLMDGQSISEAVSNTSISADIAAAWSSFGNFMGSLIDGVNVGQSAELGTAGMSLSVNTEGIAAALGGLDTLQQGLSGKIEQFLAKYDLLETRAPEFHDVKKGGLTYTYDRSGNIYLKGSTQVVGHYNEKTGVATDIAGKKMGFRVNIAQLKQEKAAEAERIGALEQIHTAADKLALKNSVPKDQSAFVYNDQVYSYDTSGNVHKVTDPGKTELYGRYEVQGGRVKITDLSGKVIMRRQDSAGKSGVTLITVSGINTLKKNIARESARASLAQGQYLTEHKGEYYGFDTQGNVYRAGETTVYAQYNLKSGGVTDGNGAAIPGFRIARNDIANAIKQEESLKLPAGQFLVEYKKEFYSVDTGGNIYKLGQADVFANYNMQTGRVTTANGKVLAKFEVPLSDIKDSLKVQATRNKPEGQFLTEFKNEIYTYDANGNVYKAGQTDVFGHYDVKTGRVSDGDGKIVAGFRLPVPEVKAARREAAAAAVPAGQFLTEFKNEFYTFDRSGNVYQSGQTEIFGRYDAATGQVADAGGAPVTGFMIPLAQIGYADMFSAAAQLPQGQYLTENSNQYYGFDVAGNVYQLGQTTVYANYNTTTGQVSDTTGTAIAGFIISAESLRNARKQDAVAKTPEGHFLAECKGEYYTYDISGNVYRAGQTEVFGRYDLKTGRVSDAGGTVVPGMRIDTAAVNAARTADAVAKLPAGQKLIEHKNEWYSYDRSGNVYKLGDAAVFAQYDLKTGRISDTAGKPIPRFWIPRAELNNW